MVERQRRHDVRFDEWAGAGEGGLVVYDPVTDAGHLLNPATAAVFEACDGRTPIDEMAARVSARTGLPTDPGIVELALGELDEAGLLAPAATEPSAAEPAGLSRRALITRLALGAGAITLLPVVETVVGSSQLAAATPPRTQTAVDSLVADPKTATTTAGTPVDVTLTTTGGFTTPTSTIFALATQPGHGAAVLVDAVATYTPGPGFTGTDTFTYIAAQCIPFSDALPACPDGNGAIPDTGTAPATVTVTVDPAPTTTTTTTAASTTSTSHVAAATAAQPTFTG
jgi:large repetitive protein